MSADFNPADYPHKALIQGTDPNAATVIAWTRTGMLDAPMLQAAVDTLRTGGHVLVMASSEYGLNQARLTLLDLLTALEEAP